MINRSKWNKEEDKALSAIIEDTMKSKSLIDWIYVEKRINDLVDIGVLSKRRTRNQCLKRWHNSLKNQWSEVDDKKLLSLVKTHELNWNKIIPGILNRSEGQIFRRYTHFYRLKIHMLAKTNPEVDSTIRTLMSKSIMTKLMSSIPLFELNKEALQSFLIQSTQSSFFKFSICKYDDFSIEIN